MSAVMQSEIRPSVCPLDCPDCCSLSATVVNERLTQVRGSKANPYTDGVICNKVSRYYPEVVYGKHRIRTPLRRTGPRGTNQFEPIDWATALDLVYEGFSRAIERNGPQSVLPFNYAGPHGELAAGSMDRRFFHKLGASLLNRGPLCGAVRGTAYSSLFGAAPGMPPEQLVHADLVVVWGNNVTVSNLHLAPLLKQVRSSGGKVVVIDPKRTRAAEQADLYLQIHPGTDVVLALGLAAELERRGALDNEFIQQWTIGIEPYMENARQYDLASVAEICRLDKTKIQSLLQLYTDAKNVAASFGNGIERGRSGGAGLRAAMALQALTGNHGRLGAGVIAKSGLLAPKTTDKLHRPDLIPAGTRTFNIVDVGKILLDQDLDIPINAVMIYNHNPVCTHPDQQQMIRALSREDLFVVGSDIVMTDSMHYCDVILPAASHFEIHDIYGSYGQNYLQRSEPVIPLVGEALPNTEIFRRLAARFGFDDECFKDTDQQLINAAIDGSDPRLNGVMPGELSTDSAIALSPVGADQTIMCDTVLPQTPSGKIELYSEDLQQRFGCGLPTYQPIPQDLPFVLITPSSEKRTNATFGGCEASAGIEEIEMHPDDAKAGGFKDKQHVLVRNAFGEVQLQLRISDAVSPGVCYSPKGTWLDTSDTGRTVNVLLDARIRTDIEDGACYNETFVSVEPYVK